MGAGCSEEEGTRKSPWVQLLGSEDAAEGSLGTDGDPGSCRGVTRERGGDVEEKDEAG